MKKIHRLLIISVSSIIFALGSLGFAIADTIKPDQYLFEDGSHTISTGLIEMEYETHSAKFDASDIKKIGNEVSEGKNLVATQMNTVAGANTVTKTGGGSSFYTFADLVNGVNNTYTKGRIKTFQDLALEKGGIYANLSTKTDPDDAMLTLLSDIEADNTASRGRVWHKYVSNTGYCNDHIRQTLDISNYDTMYVSYTFENLGNGGEFYITIDGTQRNINNTTVDISDASTLNLCTRSTNGNSTWACRYDFTAYFNCIILE